jgi:hypothetical protein
MRKINVLKWIGVALIAIISIVGFTACNNVEKNTDYHEQVLQSRNIYG